MTKALIFDCFGVLYLGSQSYLFDQTPVSQHAVLRDVILASDYGYINHDEFLQQASSLTGRTPQELERAFSSAHQRNDDLLAAIRRFRSDYKIGLLSNVGVHVIERLFTSIERSELFDAVVLSSDVSVVKPHPEMYELIAQKLAVPAKDCIMIDDIEDNVRGAEAVGMKAVQFFTTDQVLQALEELTR